jgi:hypothetical protein
MSVDNIVQICSTGEAFNRSSGSVGWPSSAQEKYSTTKCILFVFVCRFYSSLKVGRANNEQPIPLVHATRVFVFLCCGIKDWGISERRVFDYYTVKVWLKVCLTALWILISMNIVYMGSKIG